MYRYCIEENCTLFKTVQFKLLLFMQWSYM